LRKRLILANLRDGQPGTKVRVRPFTQGSFGGGGKKHLSGKEQPSHLLRVCSKKFNFPNLTVKVGEARERRRGPTLYSQRARKSIEIIKMVGEDYQQGTHDEE